MMTRNFVQCKCCIWFTKGYGQPGRCSMLDEPAAPDEGCTAGTPRDPHEPFAFSDRLTGNT